MTPVRDIDRETRWELRGIEQGIARYRRCAAARDPSTLPEAQLALRECVGRLAEAIKKDQQAAAGFVTNPVGGRPPLWAVPLLLFDAEALAVITVTGAFASAERPNTSPVNRTTLTSRAIYLSKMLQSQLRNDVWKDRSGPVLEPRPLRQIAEAYPDLDKSEWRKIKKRMAIGRTCPWSAATGVVLGAMLYERLCETCPEWFLMGLRAQEASGSAVYTLMLTDRAWELVTDLRSRAEVAAPVLMPMIVPPNPWEYKQ